MTQKEFADHLLQMGREHGRIIGLRDASDILRKHGIDVTHPARVEIFEALMGTTKVED